MLKLRYLLVIVFIIFVEVEAHSQQFNGNILYQNLYKSKLPNVTDDQLTQYMGIEQEYSIKDDTYMSKMKGMSMEYQVYDPKENRLLNKFIDNDTIYVMDASIKDDEVVEYEISDSDVNVLGYECKVLKIKSVNGSSEYYFSSEINIDSKLFKNHKYGNWGFIVEQTESLPLKIRMENEQFIMESIAIEIQQEQIEINIQSILDGKPIKHL